MDKSGINRLQPRHHMLHDLNMVLEYKGEEISSTRIPVVPAVCNDRSAVHAGILATIVDIASGSLAARAVYPDLTATGDLRIYTSRPAEVGEVTAVSSVLRIGRAAVVVETEIMAGKSEASISIGTGVATFYRLSRRDGNVKRVKDVISRQATAFPSEGLGMSKHFLDEAGLRIVDEAAGVVEIDMSEYVSNHIGALEGGMTAVMADVAGQRAACLVAGNPMMTVDLSICYLSQGRVGPFYTRTEVLRTTVDSVLTRIGVFDRGAGDLLISVAMNTAAIT